MCASPGVEPIEPTKQGTLSMLSRIVSSFAAAALVFAALAFSSHAAFSAPTGTKNVTITDPILNMKAYSLTIPANWVFQGAVIQGTPCVPGPFAVWRMSSPDGLTGFKQEPRLDWAWSENPRLRSKSHRAASITKKTYLPSTS